MMEEQNNKITLISLLKKKNQLRMFNSTAASTGATIGAYIEAAIAETTASLRKCDIQK